MKKVQALPTYQYKTETAATFPNGKKDKMQAQLYMDRTQKKLCYRTTYQLLIMNKKWLYKVDFVNKTVSIFNYTKQKKYKNYLPDPQEIFGSGFVEKFMDSTVLTKAKLVASDRKGDLVTFRIGFPEHFYIKQLIMVYDSRTKLPLLIRIKAWYGIGNGGKGTLYETVSKDYEDHVTGDVFNTQKYFTVQGGKVKLLQYKNFKVSSIL